MATRSSRIVPPKERPIINLQTGRVDDIWYEWFRLANLDLGGDRTDRVVDSPKFGDPTTGPAGAATGTVNAVIDGITYALLYVGSGGVPPLLATASPTSVFKGSIGAGSKTTPPTTVTATGGSGSYSHQWVYVSGDVTISATNPTLASTAFTATVAVGEGKDAVWKDIVTDTASGIQVSSNTVNVSIAETS